MTQGLPDFQIKMKQPQQPAAKKRKSAADGKKETKEGKKSKLAPKKVSQPLIKNGNDLSEAASEKYEAHENDNQDGNITLSDENHSSNDVGDILNKYSFLTTLSNTKEQETDQVQRKGAHKGAGLKAKSKPKDHSKKVKANKKKACLERNEDDLLEKVDRQPDSSKKQEQEFEDATEREGGKHLEPFAAQDTREESVNSVDHVAKMPNDDEGTVNTTKILNKYKFLTDLTEATLSKRDEVEEAVTMEETTADDLREKAEGVTNMVVEASKERRVNPAKQTKKSMGSTAPRKESMKERVSCEHCEKTFSTISNMKQHSTVHTNETPYSCKECSDKFANSNSLLRHKRKMHSRNLPEKTDMVPPTSA